MTLNDLMIQLQGAWHEPVLALLLLLLAAYALGSGVLRLFHAESHLLALMTGVNVLALLFRVGDSAILRLPSGWLWAGVVPFALYGGWLLLKTFRQRWRDDWALWLAMLILCGITAGSAFVPPYTWDEQSYQVALPLRYLAAGSTAVLLDNPYSALSSMPHFLMLWGTKLGGLNFSRLLIVSCYLIALPWFYWLLRRFGRATALVLTGAFLFAPVTAGMWSHVYLEPFILLNLLAGAAAIRLFRRRLFAAALFAGFAAGMAVAVKLTGGAAALAIVGMFACVLASDHVSRRETGKLLLLFGAAALFAATPFYLRPLLATGNPFYPFGAALLDANAPAAAVDVYHSLLGTSRFGVTGVKSFFAGWFLVAYQMEIYDGYLAGWQFPLLLVLGAGAWYSVLRQRMCRRFRPFLWVVTGGVLFYLFWCLSSQQTRFLLPFFFLAAFFAGSGIARLSKKWKVIALVLIAGATLISFQTSAWMNFYYTWRSMELARKAPLEFVRFADRDREYMALLDFVAQSTPSEARVMLIFDRRTLYMPRHCELGTPYFQELYFTPMPQTALAVYEELQAAKIDYIAILLGGESKRNPDPISEFDAENEWLTLHFLELVKQEKLVFVSVPESGRYRLLKVNR